MPAASTDLSPASALMAQQTLYQQLMHICAHTLQCQTTTVRLSLATGRVSKQLSPYVQPAIPLANAHPLVAPERQGTALLPIRTWTPPDKLPCRSARHAVPDGESAIEDLLEQAVAADSDDAVEALQRRQGQVRHLFPRMVQPLRLHHVAPYPCAPCRARHVHRCKSTLLAPDRLYRPPLPRGLQSMLRQALELHAEQLGSQTNTCEAHIMAGLLGSVR